VEHGPLGAEKAGSRFSSELPEGARADTLMLASKDLPEVAPGGVWTTGFMACCCWSHRQLTQSPPLQAALWPVLILSALWPPWTVTESQLLGHCTVNAVASHLCLPASLSCNRLVFPRGPLVQVEQGPLNFGFSTHTQAQPHSGSLMPLHSHTHTHFHYT
jgi:hypothetical protein